MLEVSLPQKAAETSFLVLLTARTPADCISARQGRDFLPIEQANILLRKDSRRESSNIEHSVSCRKHHRVVPESDTLRCAIVRNPICIWKWSIVLWQGSNSWTMSQAKGRILESCDSTCAIPAFRNPWKSFSSSLVESRLHARVAYAAGGSYVLPVSGTTENCILTCGGLKLEFGWWTLSHSESHWQKQTHWKRPLMIVCTAAELYPSRRAGMKTFLHGRDGAMNDLDGICTSNCQTQVLCVFWCI